MIDFILEKVFFPLVIAVTIGCLLFLVYAAYEDFVSDKLTLTKKNWTCTATKERHWMQTIVAGKSIIIVPQVSVDCVQYTRTGS